MGGRERRAGGFSVGGHLDGMEMRRIAGFWFVRWRGCECVGGHEGCGV